MSKLVPLAVVESREVAGRCSRLYTVFDRPWGINPDEDVAVGRPLAVVPWSSVWSTHPEEVVRSPSRTFEHSLSHDVCSFTASPGRRHASDSSAAWLDERPPSANQSPSSNILCYTQYSYCLAVQTLVLTRSSHLPAPKPIPSHPRPSPIPIISSRLAVQSTWPVMFSIPPFLPIALPSLSPSFTILYRIKCGFSPSCRRTSFCVVTELSNCMMK